MITKNPMQLKAFIKNKAAENRISAQLVMQNYMLERLLERISISKYKPNFIIKGGFLISAIAGLDTRTTMDLDTTVKGLKLTHESLQTMFSEICSIRVDDDVTFDITKIEDIRETDDYPGIRVCLKANYPPLSVPISVDVTTGDKITPKEVNYTFKLLFDDRTLDILAYNIETVLAEKIETVLSRSIANTRPRDFYDIYILYNLRKSECNMNVLYDALIQTTKKRGSVTILENYGSILEDIALSENMQGYWKKYQKDFGYAAEKSFEDVCDCVKTIMRKLFARSN